MHQFLSVPSCPIGLAEEASASSFRSWMNKLNWALWDTTSDRPPTRPCDTNYGPLGSAFEPGLKTPHCPLIQSTLQWKNSRYLLGQLAHSTVRPGLLHWDLNWAKIRDISNHAAVTPSRSRVGKLRERKSSKHRVWVDLMKMGHWWDCFFAWFIFVLLYIFASLLFSILFSSLSCQKKK